MKSPLFLRAWLCAAALSAGACVSLEDLPIAREDAGEELDANMEEPDAEEVDPQETDASVAPPRRDASTEPEDASIDVDATTPDDASMDDVNAPVQPPIDASLKSCAKSSDCAADQACNGTQCVPRCTSYGACVVHETEQATRTLISTGDAVMWVIGPSTDALGNPRKDAELWRMVPGSAPVRVLKNLNYIEPVIKNGYVYFAQGARLYRAPVQADAAMQSLYLTEGPDMAWVVGDSFLAFTSSRGIEVGSLDGSAAQRTIAVGLERGSPWIALTVGGDRIYFRHSGESKVLSVRVVEPFVIEKTPVEAYADFKIGPQSFVRGTTLYAPCGPAGLPWLCGSDLNDGSGITAAKIPDEAYASGGGSWRASTQFVAGDWAYWGYHGDESAELARFSLVSIGVSQAVVAKDLKDAVIPGPAAAAGDKFYFLPTASDMAPSRLIYEMPLPPAPCNNELPCPNSKTCGTDSLCH